MFHSVGMRWSPGHANVEDEVGLSQNLVRWVPFGLSSLWGMDESYVVMEFVLMCVVVGIGYQVFINTLEDVG